MAYDPVTASAVRRTGERLTLLEKHEGAKALRPAAGAERWGADPLGFIRDVLRAELWAGQRAIVTALRDHPMVAVKSAHALGKDFVAALFSLWWVYGNRGRVVLSGPTLHQVHDVLMSVEIRRAWSAATPRLFGKLWSMSLEVAGDPQVGITTVVSREDSKVTGLHAPRTLLVMSEAQGIPTAIADALRTNCVGPDDRVLMIGNALASSEAFFRRAFVPGSGWHAITLTAADLFNDGVNVPGGRRVDGALTPEQVARWRREYGPTSAYVQARVDAEFPTVGDAAITTPADLDRAAALWAERAGQVVGVRASVVVGVDVGRGLDPSALAVVSQRERDGAITVHGVETFETADGHAVAARVKKKVVELSTDRFGLGQRDPPTVVMDVIGVGASPADILAADGIVVTEFVANARASDDFDGNPTCRFANARAEAYVLFGEALARGEVALPPDPELRDELLAHTWQVAQHRTNRLQVLAKDDVRAALRRSPNRSDAVVMAARELLTGAGIGGAQVTF